MKRALLVMVAAAAVTAQTGSVIQYSKEGSFVFPQDYREWVFLSSGLNMTYAPNGASATNPRFDNVFVNPEAYRAFMKDGAWPDKTAMILEIRSSDSKVSINKDGRVQTSVAVIEAHVKDASHGGWAFYAFPNGSKVGNLFPRTANCYSCHENNAAVDTTFVQFYPTLIDIARAHGTYKTTAE